MVSSTAKTPDEYIASLPADRRQAIAAMRDVIRRNLPDGFEEGMEFGMIAWYVPLERFPDTYNGHPLGLAALASHKQYMALYLNTVYGDPQLAEWFRDAVCEERQTAGHGQELPSLPIPGGPAAGRHRRDHRQGAARPVRGALPGGSRLVAQDRSAATRLTACAWR